MRIRPLAITNNFKQNICVHLRLSFGFRSPLAREHSDLRILSSLVPGPWSLVLFKLFYTILTYFKPS
jgi:hypothetical protein